LSLWKVKLVPKEQAKRRTKMIRTCECGEAYEVTGDMQVDMKGAIKDHVMECPVWNPIDSITPTE
jgi:hypothetical protein